MKPAANPQKLPETWPFPDLRVYRAPVIAPVKRKVIKRITRKRDLTGIQDAPF